MVVFFSIGASLTNLQAAEEKDEKSKATSDAIKTEKSAEDNNKDKDKDKEDDEDHKDKDDDEEPLKIGNFALPGSQQPGPLVGFGQSIIDKGQQQIYLSGAAFIGKHSYHSEIIATYIYGITDEFSIHLDVPYEPANKDGPNKSSGFSDLAVQLEYAYYSKSEKCWSEQATIVGAVFFPNGSREKDPSTGHGSPSFFAGLTYNHTAIDWLYFGAAGMLLTTKNKDYRAGYGFLYQGGIGRNICSPPGWIYAGILEFIGEYECTDIIFDATDPDSGGNVISIVPSIWISSDNLILQLGVGYAVVEHLFGDQRKQPFSTYFNFGWTY